MRFPKQGEALRCDLEYSPFLRDKKRVEWRERIEVSEDKSLSSLLDRCWRHWPADLLGRLLLQAVPKCHRPQRSGPQVDPCARFVSDVRRGYVAWPPSATQADVARTHKVSRCHLKFWRGRSIFQACLALLVHNTWRTQGTLYTSGSIDKYT
jgi:hypothetical protein